MTFILPSYCWFIPFFYSSSQAVVSFSLCFAGPCQGSVTGCHDAEAAVFFNFLGQPRTRQVFSVCVPAVPSAFAVPSTQAGGVGRQEPV